MAKNVIIWVRLPILSPDELEKLEKENKKDNVIPVSTYTAQNWKVYSKMTIIFCDPGIHDPRFNFLNAEPYFLNRFNVNINQLCRAAGIIMSQIQQGYKQ